MPTILNYLGYDHPYIGFGKDLLQTTDSTSYAVNYTNGVYQYFDNQYMLQFDGNRSKALYEYRTDSLLEHNLLDTRQAQQADMEQKLKAIIQQYMERMNSDNILWKDESNH